MTAQNQSLNTRNYQTTIIKNGVDPKYRICHQYDETVDHLVSGCSAIVLLNIKTDMTELANTFIGRSINITKPHTIPTGMNIKQSLLLKHRAPQSLGFDNTYRQKKIDTISLSRHEQVCLSGLRFERYFSHHRSIMNTEQTRLNIFTQKKIYANKPDNYN